MTKKPKSTSFYTYAIVAAAFVIMTLLWSPWNSYGTFFKSMLTEFPWTRTEISGAVSLSNVMFGLICIFSATLSERYGIKRVATICCLLLGISYLLMSQMHNIWQLYLYIGVMVPLGMSSYIPLLSLIARRFTKTRSLMTGIVLSGLGLSTIIMPPVSNMLISLFQWRISYIIIGLVTIVISIIAVQFLKDTPKISTDNSKTSDLGTDKNEPIKMGDSPSLKAAIFTRQFIYLSGLYFFFLYCMLTIVVHIVIHATGLGIPPDISASVLAVIGFTLIIGMNLMGTIADRFGIKLSIGISFILMTISFIWLVYANTIWSIFLFAVVFGYAYGGVQALFSPLVAELFGLRFHGVILALAALIGSVGGALGSAVTGYIFDVLGNYSLAFVVCAIMAFLGTVLVPFLKPIQRYASP